MRDPAGTHSFPFTRRRNRPLGTRTPYHILRQSFRLVETSSFTYGDLIDVSTAAFAGKDFEAACEVVFLRVISMGQQLEARAANSTNIRSALPRLRNSGLHFDICFIASIIRICPCPALTRQSSATPSRIRRPSPVM